MQLTELFSEELEREAIGTRHALERVPEGRDNWKPHDKSMALGNLATLVATMPSWIVMMIDQDELDLNPPGGKKYKTPELRTARERVEAHNDCVAKARAALARTSEEHLMKPWRLLVAGQVVDEKP